MRAYLSVSTGCVLSVCFLVTGCASVFEGTSQEILVTTDPPGASCTLEREGVAIAAIPTTPGAAFVKKNKYDIVIKCDKEGFVESSYLNHSDVAAATVGNVLGGVFTGGAAWAIDSASGADNKYDSPVSITLAPKSTATLGPEDEPDMKGKMAPVAD